MKVCGLHPTYLTAFNIKDSINTILAASLLHLVSSLSRLLLAVRCGSSIYSERSPWEVAKPCLLLPQVLNWKEYHIGELLASMESLGYDNQPAALHCKRLSALFLHTSLWLLPWTKYFPLILVAYT